MSRSIQESLDLPVLEDLLKSASTTDAEDEPEVTDDMVEDFSGSSELSTSMNSGLIKPEVLDDQQARSHSSSMDTIHRDALQHSKDLMDLGYNVDIRSASKIFESAAGMMRLAMDAANSKREAQLKRRKLDLDAAKLEILLKNAKGGQQAGDTVDAEAVVIVEDRNEILKRMREEAKNAAQSPSSDK